MNEGSAFSNHRLQPLMNATEVAAVLGYASAESLRVALSRGLHPFLKQNTVYIGRRPMYKRSTVEAYIESRTATVLATGA